MDGHSNDVNIFHYGIVPFQRQIGKAITTCFSRLMNVNFPISLPSLVLLLVLLLIWTVAAIPPLPTPPPTPPPNNNPQEVARQLKILFQASQQIARYAARSGVLMGGGGALPSFLLQNLFTTDSQKQVLDMVENAASQDELAKELFRNYKKFTQRMRTDVVPHLNQIVTGRPRGNPAIEYSMAAATLFTINVHMAQEYVRQSKGKKFKSECERHQHEFAVALIHSSAVDGIFRLGKGLLRNSGVTVGTHLDGRVLFMGSTVLTLGAMEVLLWKPDWVCEQRRRVNKFTIHGDNWNTLTSPLQQTLDRHVGRPLRALDQHLGQPLQRLDRYMAPSLRHTQRQLDRAGQEASRHVGIAVHNVALTSLRQANAAHSLICYQAGRLCRWVQRRSN